MTGFLGFLQTTVVETRSLTGVSAVDQLLAPVLVYAPKIVGAIVLLIVAWIVASIIKWIVVKGLTAAGLDKRLATPKQPNTGRELIGTLATITYWVVFLFFVPMILGALDLGGALAPINALVGNIFGFLPNLLAAALIFIIGFILAGIVRQLVTGLLESLGVNTFAARMGLGTTLGAGGLAGLLGTILYVLILLPIITAALNALNLPSVSQPITHMLDIILAAIPNIFGAVLILAIAYFVGTIVSNLVTGILTGVGFNNIPATLGLSAVPTEGKRSASSLVGSLSFIGIMFFAVIEAARILNFALLSEIVAQLTVFGGQLIGGLVIFAIGMYLAQLAANFIRQSGMANADTLAVVARVAILVFTGAMALQRMGIADSIVNLTFGLTLGAIAVACAIAFGIGGRDVAARIVNNLYAENQTKIVTDNTTPLV